MSATILPALGGIALTVSVAFGASPDADPASFSWTDVTDYVMVDDNIVPKRGRADDAAAVEPSRLTLTVINTAGRFSPGNTSSPYYPNVKLRVPIKVDVAGSTRFSGFVDSWPTSWPAKVTTFAVAQISASGRWLKLSKAPPFKSAAEELISYLNPSSYYPMTDGPSALAWADRSKNTRPDVQVVFWTPGGRDWTSLNTDQSGGGVDRKSAAFYPSTLPIPVAGPVTIPFTGHNPGVSASFLYYANGYSSDQSIVDLVDTTGALWRISQVSYVLTLSRTVGTTTTVLATLGTTLPNPVLLNWYLVSGVLNVTFWSPITSSSVVVSGVTQIPTVISAVLYPLVNVVDPADVVAGHVALFDDSMTANELSMLYSVFVDGQVVDAAVGNPTYNPEGWIRARARLAGYPDSLISLDSSSALLDYKASNAVLGGKNRVDALRVAADGELGLLYETLPGGIGFRSRSSRYVTAPWISVDIALGDVAESPEPVFDDKNVINDATVTQRQGQGRYVDPVSVADVGLYEKSVSTIGYQADVYSLDFDASQVAAWIVNTHSKVLVRVPQLTLRLSNRSALLTAWLAGEPIGSRIDVLNVPSQMGVASWSFFIEGYTETITPFEYLVTINCSPVDPYDRLFRVQDSTLGRLELDGQTLTSGVTTTATSWSVTTSAGKPLLSTSSSPFDLEVAGERVTVTAVTGASSPQTLTVTRSVNGVVKAQSAGAVPKLWRPGVLKI